jgi:hypothetical protein
MAIPLADQARISHIDGMLVWGRPPLHARFSAFQRTQIRIIRGLSRKPDNLLATFENR